MIIDSHVHVWAQNPEKYPWSPIGGYVPKQSAPIEDLVQVMDEAHVDKAVLVQPTPYGWDNSYLMDALHAHENRFCGVVLVNPLSAHASLDLRLLRKRGARGLRINLHLNPPSMVENKVFLGLWNSIGEMEMPVCFQLTPLYFSMVRALAEMQPNIPIILDHLSRPDIGSNVNDSTFKDLLTLAQYPNIFVKLSGLNYYSAQKSPYADTWELLEAALDHFSARRCMWGSDFPFVQEHWNYSNALHFFQNELDLSDEDREWVLGKTAHSIWWDGIRSEA